MRIHDRFLRSAEERPQAGAVVAAGRTLTYADLLGRAKQLAALFVAHLPSQARIVLDLPKSDTAIAAMLGALMAGCTYVPLDSRNPLSRRRFILEDCRASALVVDRAASHDWLAAPDATAGLELVVSPEATVGGHHTVDLEALGSLGRDRWQRRVSDEDLAYILYTSGSTGEPKGVMITHGNAEAFVAWVSSYFDLGPADRIAVHSPLYFDLAVLDIYGGLSAGAALVLVDERTAQFPEAVVNLLRSQQVTVLYAVPSALNALRLRSTLGSGGIPSLRLLLYAGEAFLPSALAQLMAQLPDARVFNLYGPIETNVITAHAVTSPPEDDERVPLGCPVAGADVLLLDAHGRIIDSVDCEGEIAVIGPSVSPGYLNRPDLTAQSHVPLKASEAFRTGDYGFHDTDGLLHFTGRRDHIVKVRGFRCELGEVEVTLASCPGVAEAAVIAIPDPVNTNKLVAFVTPAPGAEVTKQSLSAWARSRLPSYMTPSQVEIRNTLPYTGTGKISRRALLLDLQASAQ